MTADLRRRILALNTEMAGDALRVLAAAEKTAELLPKSDEEAESGLCFLGLIGLEDPPRPEAKQAVAECLKAGIRPIMITGDHVDTAVAIAKELGILSEGRKAITGAQLSAMSDEEFEKYYGKRADKARKLYNGMIKCNYYQYFRY